MPKKGTDVAQLAESMDFGLWSVDYGVRVVIS